MDQATRTLISAIRFQPPGGSLAFMVTPTGGSYPSIGVKLYIDHSTLRRASIQALQSNVSTLLGYKISDVSSLLLRALEGDFSAFLDRWFKAHATNNTLTTICTEADVVRLTTAVIQETASAATQKWWLTLAKGLRIEKALVSSTRLMWQGADRIDDLGAVVGGGRAIDLSLFPPIKADFRRITVTDDETWLGVRAGTDTQAISQLSQMFGAISMALDAQASRTFSGATPIEGLVSISADGRWRYLTRGPTFPPIINSAHLSSDRVDWIGRLVDGAGRSSEMDLRLRTGLDYVYAGWVPASRLGFVHNAIAFDALFGEDGKVTKSIVSGVTSHAHDITMIDGRIRALLKMRNALIHGAAASVELTPDYLMYWDKYDADPHSDQVRILQRCFQRLVP